jgi:hypothetical protein
MEGEDISMCPLCISNPVRQELAADLYSFNLIIAICAHHPLTSTTRYTDFIVNEIALDGTVIHLTTDKAPKFRAVANVSPPNCLSLP